ncbi:hypothetical protein ABE607_16900 [Comamonas aquatica]|uniref:hypothetical protein n=1 Tax=Comamonas aquatica TaxID=225991 RepID=UPI00320983BC
MRLKSLALGILSLPALMAFAADVPVPNPPPGAVNANPNYLEYKKTGNTYTWNPVGTSTPPGSGSISFPSTQTVSTVEPKFTATGDLPYQHKGGAGAKVSISTGINKQALAKAASDAVKGAAAIAAAGSTNPYVQVGALACMAFCAPLAEWGIDKLKNNGDGTFSVSYPDPSVSTGVSDGFDYFIQYYPGYYSSPSAACSGTLSLVQANNASSTVTLVGVTSTNCVYSIVDRWGNTSNGLNNILSRNSSCPAGSPVVGGVCNGEVPKIEKPLERVFEDNIVNKPWEKKYAEMAAYAIANGIYKIGGDIYTDGTSLDITGPYSVPIGQTISTSPVNLVPGTTTPAPVGHTGPTEPGTVTQTTTTTAQNAFRPGSSGSTGSGSSSGPGASMTTSQKTETKTSITNNITNVTNIVNTETKTEDKPPEDTATDTPLAGIPELYKQKYPDGISGVWNSFKTKFNQTPFVNLIHQLTPNIPSGGSCPAWTIDLSWTPGGSMGVYRLGDDYCFIWPILKIIIIITALFTARRLVFGG